MSTNPDDSATWALALQGDGEAFGVLFDRHRDRVARHSLRLVASPQDSDDVVAITFLEAWRRRGQVRLVDNSILPWLIVTATNSAQNLRRSARRHSALLARLPEETSTIDDVEYIDGGPASDALRELPLRDRRVIILCVIEGLSSEDAGSLMGVSPGAVRTRLHRAKQRLATTIALYPSPLNSIPEEAK